jgi:hypothetical protein
LEQIKNQKKHLLKLLTEKQETLNLIKEKEEKKRDNFLGSFFKFSDSTDRNVVYPVGAVGHNSSYTSTIHPTLVPQIPQIFNRDLTPPCYSDRSPTDSFSKSSTSFLLNKNLLQSNHNFNSKLDEKNVTNRENKNKMFVQYFTEGDIPSNLINTLDLSDKKTNNLENSVHAKERSFCFNCGFVNYYFVIFFIYLFIYLF